MDGLDGVEGLFEEMKRGGQFGKLVLAMGPRGGRPSCRLFLFGFAGCLYWLVCMGWSNGIEFAGRLSSCACFCKDKLGNKSWNPAANLGVGKTCTIKKLSKHHLSIIPDPNRLRMHSRPNNHQCHLISVTYQKPHLICDASLSMKYNWFLTQPLPPASDGN